MTDLDRQIEQLARTPVLLIASDYDGTLAPIVNDPSEARPLREAVVALRTLAGLTSTHVAVISGRALRDLSELAGLPEEVHLVGSHGSEFDLDFAATLAPEARALRQRVLDELTEIARMGDGFIVETKPASVAFHYRNAAPDLADRALRTVRDRAGAIEGVVTRVGKKVVELGVVATNKGDALMTMRQRVGATAVIFLGDDVTDESAFETLCGPDVGIKVGAGESVAMFRVEQPLEAVRLLARLAEARAEWQAGGDAVHIERHTLLSDQRTAALLTPDARVVWLCVPRIDSPAIFAELVGGPAAGYFSVAPTDGRQVLQQRYLGETMVVETQWADLTVTDFLDCSRGRPTQRPGRTDLIRIIEGRGPVSIEFAPRIDFGRMPTVLVAREGGIAVEDVPEPIILRSPGVQWTIETEGVHQTARAQVDLARGPVTLELIHGSGRLSGNDTDLRSRLDATHGWWSDWASALYRPPVAQELVTRSALLLKALCHGPTGAMAAAATTSLPEAIGGVRNWDYRYCWIRDAALTAASLARLGSTDEAMHYLDWVLGVVDDAASPEQVRPVYTMSGSRLGSEAEVSELSGYRGSRPVRVGNAAGHQVQLDVFGPVVDLVASLAEMDAPVSGEHWRLVRAMVDAVRARWHEPDHGIWEIRRPRRHHVYSKIMCWLAVDRGLALADRMLDRDLPDWRELRSTIAADVIENGYNEEVGAFVAAYDGHDLDAASLHIGLSGMLPPDDRRFASTVEAIEKALRDGPVVYRYRADDGLPGFEGGFTLCASWLARSYLLLGRTADAWALFEAIVDQAGPTGMMAEEYSPHGRHGLGNVPQAFSHIGLIDCALDLSKKLQHTTPSPTR